MLKSKSKIIFCILVTLVTIILISSVCFATDDIMPMSNGNVVDTEQDSTTTPTDDEVSTPNWINDDLYLSEDDIVINGIVDGNVFAIGNTVTINAEIAGDVFVLAKTININGGYIYSSLFALAETINVNGIIYDVYSVCDNFNLQDNGYVYRDLRLTSKNVNMAGNVRRNAYISSDNIQFSETHNPYVAGNFTYSAKKEVSIPEDVVAGEVTFNEKVNVNTNTSSNAISNYIFNALTVLVNTLVVSLLAIWLTPKFVKKVTNMGIKKTLIALPVGLVSLILIPIIFVIMLLTIIGLTPALALLALYCLVVAFSLAFSSMVVGALLAKLFKLKGNVKFVSLALVSSLVIYLLTLIPYVGGIVSSLSLIVGIGTVVLNLFTKVPVDEVVNEVKE